MTTPLLNILGTRGQGWTEYESPNLDLQREHDLDLSSWEFPKFNLATRNTSHEEGTPDNKINKRAHLMIAQFTSHKSNKNQINQKS